MHHPAATHSEKRNAVNFRVCNSHGQRGHSTMAMYQTRHFRRFGSASIRTSYEVRSAFLTTATLVVWQWHYIHCDCRRSASHRNYRRGDHISPVLCQLHRLPVQRRVDFKLACFVYSSLSGQASPYLADDVGSYTWFRKVQDVDSARPPTDRVLFHGRTTHLVTEALLPPGHVFGTASQYTCATKTSVITVFGVNSKRFGFNVASGAQCHIPINCAIQNTLTKLLD